MKRYRLQYAGQYSSSQLYAYFFDYEEAMAAKRQAVACALANGNRQLAMSFDIVG